MEDEREKPLRLDQLLVSRGLFASRSRARDAVRRGTVKVDGRSAGKPGQVVSLNCRLEVDDPARTFVSRAALKLIAALDSFSLDPSGMIALDIGSSTGGFTQVLLERGARRVFAVDVGHRQLAPSLREDPRVTVLEGLNARRLDAEHLDGCSPAFLVCDVSFISLKLVLPPALALAAPGARAVFLVKPQFEAGREAIGKGGILRDRNAAAAIAQNLSDWLARREDWRVIGLVASPILGDDGNREYLLVAEKAATD